MVLLRVISGKRKSEGSNRFGILRSGLKEIVTQVVVPTEKVYKIERGKKVIRERNILGGYILVEAVSKKMTEVKLFRLSIIFRM